MKFWYWDAYHNIMVCADIAKVAKNIASGGTIFAYKLNEKASVSFKGAYVGTGNTKDRARDKDAWIEVPWCGGEIFLFGNKAEDVLTVNREALGNNDIVKGIRRAVREGVLKGFECLLLDYYDFCLGKDDPVEWGTDFHKYLQNSTSTVFLMAMACDCLKRWSLQSKEKDTRIIVNENKAKKFDALLHEHLLSVAYANNHISCWDVDLEDNKSIGRMTVAALDIFIDTDSTWFTTGLPSGAYGGKVGCTGRKSTALVYEDMLSYNPIPVYWADVFYIGNEDDNTAPTPVYKYCSIARSSFKLSPHDTKMLFIKSNAFGNLQRRKLKYKQYDTNRYIELSGFFGDRHIFPAMDEFPNLAVPYESHLAPASLENCGHILISPLNGRVFCNKKFKELCGKKDLMPGEIKDFLKKELYDAKGDKYGFRALIDHVMYVHKEDSPLKTSDDYIDGYEKFLEVYIQRL